MKKQERAIGIQLGGTAASEHFPAGFSEKSSKKQLNSDNITKFTYYHFLIFSNMI
jgi:hypothetical protein